MTTKMPVWFTLLKNKTRKLIYVIKTKVYFCESLCFRNNRTDKREGNAFKTE